MEEAYLGVDIGSISTKGVIIDKNYKILASEYIWTEGDPMGAARKQCQKAGRCHAGGNHGEE